MAGADKTGRHELANRLSEWSQVQMGCQISPEIFLQIFHSPEMVKIWTHIVSNVKSATPLESLHLKIEELVKPASTGDVSLCKRLCEDDSALDLEIVNLQKNIEVCAGIMTTNNAKKNKLQSEVFIHPSRMQVMSAYCTLLENNIKNIKKMVGNIETALDQLPRTSVSNSSALLRDFQECLELFHRYYLSTKGEQARKAKHKVQNKIRQMVRVYQSEQFLELLNSEVDDQKLPISEQHSDMQMIKRIMENCLSDLQAAHRESFTTVQAVWNKIQILELQKAELLEKLRLHFQSHVDREHLDELCETKLNLIRKQEIIKSFSEPKVPDGMPSLNHTELQLVQRQIENGEQSIKNVRLQMAKVCHANKLALDSLRSAPLNNRSGFLESSALESKNLHVDFNLDEFCQHLEAAENLLPQLRTCKPLINDLGVRPGSCLMNSRLKEDLQFAINMPLHEAPEMLGKRLQEQMDLLEINRNKTRILTHLFYLLDLEDVKQKFNETFNCVENSSIKASHLTEKANSFSVRIKSLASCEELKLSLHDFKEQPAFSESIF